MKREIKNHLTKQKIITGAFDEFGSKSYSEASLNTICTENSISKGIIYHYFKDKDELYLYCIKECFTALTQFLSENLSENAADIEIYLENYFKIRFVFFQKNPHFLKLFCDAVLNPPLQLAEDIHLLEQDFLTFNQHYFEGALDKIVLRDSLTKDDVMDYFLFIQDSFNQYFYKTCHKTSDTGQLLTEHDRNMCKILQLMLYGIIKKELPSSERKILK